MSPFYYCILKGERAIQMAIHRQTGFTVALYDLLSSVVVSPHPHVHPSPINEVLTSEKNQPERRNESGSSSLPPRIIMEDPINHSPTRHPHGRMDAAEAVGRQAVWSAIGEGCPSVLSLSLSHSPSLWL